MKKDNNSAPHEDNCDSLLGNAQKVSYRLLARMIARRITCVNLTDCNGKDKTRERKNNEKKQSKLIVSPEKEQMNKCITAE